MLKGRDCNRRLSEGLEWIVLRNLVALVCVLRDGCAWRVGRLRQRGYRGMGHVHVRLRTSMERVGCHLVSFCVLISVKLALGARMCLGHGSSLQLLALVQRNGRIFAAIMYPFFVIRRIPWRDPGAQLLLTSEREPEIASAGLVLKRRLLALLPRIWPIFVVIQTLFRQSFGHSQLLCGVKVLHLVDWR